MILDLTKAELPDWWPEWMPKELPVKSGEHDKEFDIVMEDLPVVLRHRMYNFYCDMYGREYTKKKPVGFNNIPKGAVLR